MIGGFLLMAAGFFLVYAGAWLIKNEWSRFFPVMIGLGFTALGGAFMVP